MDTRMNRLSWGLVRGIVSTAFGIVFGLSLGACIVAILATRFFDYSILTVQSDSMKPALERGDIVVTRPVAAKDLRSGDVVYFTERTTGLPFVHRVVAIHRTVTEIRDGKTNELVDENVKYGFVTKGDAALLADPAEVDVDTLRGEAWFYVPNAGILSGDLPLQWALLGFAAATGRPSRST